MRLLYTKPVLNDMSQGSRIAFARQFRLMIQGNVSDRLGLTGECKRRTMTRYEKGNRNPKEDRTKEITEELFSNKCVSENMPSTTISKEKLGINILDI